MPEGQPPQCEPGEPLRVNVLFKHIQRMLTADSAVMAETGDSWFNCQKLRLPDGCGYGDIIAFVYIHDLAAEFRLICLSFD